VPVSRRFYLLGALIDLADVTEARLQFVYVYHQRLGLWCPLDDVCDRPEAFDDGERTAVESLPFWRQSNSSSRVKIPHPVADVKNLSFMRMS